jgi:hypothetical protein
VQQTEEAEHLVSVHVWREELWRRLDKAGRAAFYLKEWNNLNYAYGLNTLCGQNVPRSKHSVSVIKTSQLMLNNEIIAVCSQIHTKHINTLCGQTVEFVSVKPGGTYSDHRGLYG